MQSRKELGDKGERLAADFIIRRGYEIEERKFRYARAEIDIIARKGNLVVFCEVKTRKSDTYGTGEEAVDAKKQARIRRAAEGYISLRKIDSCEFRFDVIVVDIRSGSTHIRMIEDAF